MEPLLRAIVAKASTLAERSAGAFVPDPAAVDEALLDARLHAWKLAAAGDDDASFALRLRWAGLDESSARRTLGPVRMHPDAELPSWALLLSSVLSRAHERSAQERCLHPQRPIVFEQVLLPFVRVARQHCARSAAAAYALLSDAAHAALERALLEALALEAARALWLELCVAHSQDDSALDRLLAPRHASTRFEAFVAQLLEDGLRAFFLEHSVLARVLSRTTQLWIDSTVELLTRLQRDLGALQTFLASPEPLRVTALQPALSDPHHGQRSVAVLTFHTGAKLVYKPRDLAIEQQWGELLQALTRLGAPQPLRAARVLCGDGYGWAEHIESGPCPEHAVERFFERAGALVCLVRTLQGTDCHAGNLIFAADDPVLIDVETLFTPEVPDLPLGAEAVRDARKRLLRSVLGTYLLPIWSSDLNGGAVFDGSGLGAELDPEAALTTQRFEHINTDRMQWVSAAQPGVEPARATTADGRTLEIATHEAALLRGFDAMYGFLVRERARLLAADGPLSRVRSASVRFVHRNTSVYTALLERLRQPELLRDGIDRSLALEQLALAGVTGELREARSGWRTLFEAERNALERGDVPHFTLPADSTALHALPDQALDHWFARSGLSSAQRCLERLDERDLTLQHHLIRSSLRARATLGASTSHGARDAIGEQPIDPELCLREALAIAETLAATAILADDGSAAWLQPAWSRRKLIESPKRELMVVGLDLYDGATGIALFLAALHQVTGRAELRSLALAALHPLRCELTQSPEETACELGLGGLSGLGSIVYGVSQISRLLDEPDLLSVAQIAAALITPARIAADRALDITAGAAGALLGLLALYERACDAQALATAQACAEHVCARLEPAADGAFSVRTLDGRFLSGFSHGAAGIAYALQRLYTFDADARWLDVARQLIAFERVSFDRVQRDWPDLRANDGQHFGSSYCHGAPGIALSRIAMAFDLEADAGRRELERALELSARAALGERDGLCCGHFGVVDILATAGHKLQRPELYAHAQCLAHGVVARARTHGHYALELESVGQLACRGLFQGTAGIGYALLRLGFPEALPDPLLLC